MRGDARVHDDRDERARPKTSVFCKLFLRQVHYDRAKRPCDLDNLKRMRKIPVVLLYDELISRGNKELNNPNGEVLVPIIRRRQIAGEGQHIAGVAKISKDDS